MKTPKKTQTSISFYVILAIVVVLLSSLLFYTKNGYALNMFPFLLTNIKYLFYYLGIIFFSFLRYSTRNKRRQYFGYVIKIGSRSYTPFYYTSKRGLFIYYFVIMIPVLFYLSLLYQSSPTKNLMDLSFHFYLLVLFILLFHVFVFILIAFKSDEIKIRDIRMQQEEERKNAEIEAESKGILDGGLNAKSLFVIIVLGILIAGGILLAAALLGSIFF
ncbi:hypothetical protein H6501_01985 [Candidatus Woesearchaeota archaeon]|nr:hypothetical protein [Nanoarchaeota archaeon]MCB9370346.1 hypothetical protein [Candidatus Woesearchaeota archaeon]USN44867.1 MAG: hypothetical protein H6500_03430 [Candidatus Woesearchaeota archaeon]